MIWQDAASAWCNEIIWFQLIEIKYRLYCKITQWKSYLKSTQIHESLLVFMWIIIIFNTFLSERWKIWREEKLSCYWKTKQAAISFYFLG